MGIGQVFSDILDERERQDNKWGEQNNRPSEWLSILGEEFGEVCRAVCEMELTPADKKDPKWWANYREELVHMTAVGVAMIQCYDRHNGNVSARSSASPPLSSALLLARYSATSEGRQNATPSPGSGSQLDTQA